MADQNPTDIAAVLRTTRENDSLKNQQRLHLALDLLQIAIPTVLRAGAAGNVQCEEASKQLIPILDKLNKL